MSRHPALSKADDPRPFYFQFQQHLRRRIERGEWQPGDRVPAEPDLATEYGLARGTIREGLDVLLREGILERHHGRGTFVRDPRIVSEWNTFYGFMPALRALGHEVTARVVGRVQVRRAGDKLGGHLALAPDDPVVQLRRVILANGEPFLVTTAHLPAERCPGLADVDFARHWLFETLEARYGIKIVRQERWLEPILPQPADRRLLGLAEPSPCLLVEELSRMAGDTPVSFSRTVVRGDRCRPYFRLTTP